MFHTKERIVSRWRTWATARHIKAPASNENLVFCAHRWIQSAFPAAVLDLSIEKEEEAEGDADRSYDPYELGERRTMLLSTLLCARIELRNAMQESNVQYYQGLRHDSAQVFARAMMHRCFRAIAAVPRYFGMFDYCVVARRSVSRTGSR